LNEKGKPKKSGQAAKQEERLFKIIAEQKVEIDFLKNALFMVNTVQERLYNELKLHN